MLHYNPQFVSLITIACCVLHNICKKANLDNIDVHAVDVEEERLLPLNANVEIHRGNNFFHKQGQQIRSLIVNQLH